MHPQSTSFAFRFWSRVAPDGPTIRPELGPCWLWDKRVDKWGYGVLKRPHDQRPYLAHRVSWEITRGSIPPGLWVLHRCDTPACVRPSHLYLGTPADNVRDREARGRGSQPPHTPRLTLEQIHQIRERYARGGVTQRALGDEYGVSNMTISYITRGNYWLLDRTKSEQ